LSSVIQECRAIGGLGQIAAEISEGSGRYRRSFVVSVNILHRGDDKQ
jgi:hypothetical protein